MVCRVSKTEAGGELTFRIVGDLDAAGAIVLEQVAVSEARHHYAGDITIDCSQIEYIDLRGLDVLLEVTLASKRAGTVTLLEPGVALRKLLEYTKTGIVFTMVGAQEPLSC